MALKNSRISVSLNQAAKELNISIDDIINIAANTDNKIKVSLYIHEADTDFKCPPELFNRQFITFLAGINTPNGVIQFIDYSGLSWDGLGGWKTVPKGISHEIKQRQYRHCDTNVIEQVRLQGFWDVLNPLDVLHGKGLIKLHLGMHNEARISGEPIQAWTMKEIKTGDLVLLNDCYDKLRSIAEEIPFKTDLETGTEPPSPVASIDNRMAVQQTVSVSPVINNAVSNYHNEYHYHIVNKESSQPASKTPEQSVPADTVAEKPEKKQLVQELGTSLFTNSPPTTRRLTTIDHFIKSLCVTLSRRTGKNHTPKVHPGKSKEDRLLEIYELAYIKLGAKKIIQKNGKPRILSGHCLENLETIGESAARGLLIDAIKYYESQNQQFTKHQ